MPFAAGNTLDSYVYVHNLCLICVTEFYQWIAFGFDARFLIGCYCKETNDIDKKLQSESRFVILLSHSNACQITEYDMQVSWLFCLVYNVSSNAFVLKLCGFDPPVPLHTPYITHCGNYVAMLVL